MPEDESDELLLAAAGGLGLGDKCALFAEMYEGPTRRMRPRAGTSWTGALKLAVTLGGAGRCNGT